MTYNCSHHILGLKARNGQYCINWECPYLPALLDFALAELTMHNTSSLYASKIQRHHWMLADVFIPDHTL